MDKHIIIRFDGGDCDGQVMDSANETGTNPTEGTRGVLWLTNGGELGARFWKASEGALEHLREDAEAAERAGHQPHVYKVTDRQEDDGSLKLMLTFVGHDPKTSGKESQSGESSNG